MESIYSQLFVPHHSQWLFMACNMNRNDNNNYSYYNYMGFHLPNFICNQKAILMASRKITHNIIVRWISCVPISISMNSGNATYVQQRHLMSHNSALHAIRLFNMCVWEDEVNGERLLLKQNRNC